MTPRTGKRAARSSSPSATSTPRLLSGGNPQIAKGAGEGPVRAYLAAMPGWKQSVGRRIDELVTRALPDPPGVRKAVKWNSPLYGVRKPGEPEPGGTPSTGPAVGAWFLSFHCFAKYVKVAFFDGASLRPVPPGESKQKKVRYLDIREDDAIDEAQFTDWVRQAARLPGETM